MAPDNNLMDNVPSGLLDEARRSAERFIENHNEMYAQHPAERLLLLSDYCDYQESQVAYHTEFIEKYKHDSFIIYGHVRALDECRAKIKIVSREIDRQKAEINETKK